MALVTTVTVVTKAGRRVSGEDQADLKSWGMPYSSWVPHAGWTCHPSSCFC